MKNGVKGPKGVNQVTFYPMQADGRGGVIHPTGVTYDDELQHADIAASSNLNSQNQFNTSSTGMDAY